MRGNITIPPAYREAWKAYNKWDSLKALKYFLKGNKKHVAKCIEIKPEDERFIEENTNPILSYEGLKTKYKDFPNTCHPIGVDDLGRIICMPLLKEATNINVYGNKGVGKTVLAHHLVDISYHKFHHNIFIASDFHNESWIWTFPSQESKFRRGLDPLDLKGMPLPIILIVPFIKGEDVDIPYSNIPKLYLKLNWKHFVRYIGKYIDLEKSEKYFHVLEEDLLQCTSKDEVIEVLEKKITKKVSGSYTKIVTIIKNILNDGIINFDKNCKALDLVFDKNTGETDNLIPLLIKNKMIPCFITKPLYERQYIFQGYINSVLEDLFNKQRADYKGIKKERLVLFIDEINTLLSSKNHNEITGTLMKIGHNSRAMNVSLIMCSQNPLDPQIPQIIRDEAGFVFAFKLKDENAKYIKGEFGLTKYQFNDLKELPPLTCYAKTDYHFIVHDGSVHPKKTKGPIKIRLLPPMSQHLGETTISSLHHESSTEEILIKDYSKEDMGEFPSFSRNFAFTNNIKLFRPNTKQNILTTQVSHNIKIPELLKPKYFKALDYRKFYFEDKPTDIATISYDRLKSQGYYICRKKCAPYERTERNQTIVYVIRHIDELSNPKAGFYIRLCESKPSCVTGIVYHRHNKEIKLHGQFCSPMKYKVDVI